MRRLGLAVLTVLLLPVGYAVWLAVNLYDLYAEFES